MRTFRQQSILIIFAVLAAATAEAQISPLESELGDSYYYIDHYEVAIESPMEDVWPYVLQMGSWMPWAAGDESGSMVSEGDVIKLYDDFHIEVAKVIPESMVLLVNLPNTQEGEDTQGVAMVTAKESDGTTLVSLFMSRIYYWFNVDENNLRARRSTSEFSESRQTTYKEVFLLKLKELAESDEK